MDIIVPLIIRNCESVSIDLVPVVSVDNFRAYIIDAASQGLRICSLFAHRSARGENQLFAVLGTDTQGTLEFLSCIVNTTFESMNSAVPQVHLFEREIFEQYGVVPQGHPWLKPVRFPSPPQGSNSPAATIGIADFFSMRGEEVHEVAVGPVHAGVIEPGHFRFQCHGENVYHLEISLGYQNRGIEEALACRMHDKRRLFMMETIAGDTTVGHATAYCQVIEALMRQSVSARFEALRAIALELERCANHAGDLGALAGDVGFLPAQSFCGRIRGDFLNMSALLCGSRFSRGLVIPGGMAYDISASEIAELKSRLTEVRDDITGAAELLLNNASVQARFEHTGIITKEACIQLGIVGPAARASGCIRDVRQDYPSGSYRFHHIPVISGLQGDVYDRATVRWREMQQSMHFILDLLDNLPIQEAERQATPAQPAMIAVSLVEGWRGEICHVVITDAQGGLSRYKIVDPSFHNWTGLALALRNMQISDFPLCNKSFNLSYCGHDL